MGALPVWDFSKVDGTTPKVIINASRVRGVKGRVVPTRHTPPLSRKSQVRASSADTAPNARACHAPACLWLLTPWLTLAVQQPDQAQDDVRSFVTWRLCPSTA
eukprot:3941489-Rhodomonas_salina.1